MRKTILLITTIIAFVLIAAQSKAAGQVLPGSSVLLLLQETSGDCLPTGCSG